MNITREKKIFLKFKLLHEKKLSINDGKLLYLKRFFVSKSKHFLSLGGNYFVQTDFQMWYRSYLILIFLTIIDLNTYAFLEFVFSSCTNCKKHLMKLCSLEFALWSSSVNHCKKIQIQLPNVMCWGISIKFHEVL